LIDGFPRSLEQALYIDQHLKEIKIVLYFHAKKEILFNRNKGNKLKIKNFQDKIIPIVDYYTKYGIIRNVDANSPDTNIIYSNFKQQLLPEIYLIIGKRYSGKSEIANLLSQRIPFRVISFPDFLKHPMIGKKKIDNEFVINFFLKLGREGQNRRCIIENFPANKEFLNLFVKNGKNIRKVIYLDADNNICSERMKRLGKDHNNYIGCAQLNKEISEFERSKDLLEYYKKKTEFIQVDANPNTNIIMKELMKKLQPSLLIFSSDDSSKNLKTDIMDVFVKDHGYEILNVSNIINEVIQRGTELGLKLKSYSEKMTHIPNNLIIELLKSIIFKEANNKYILVNYPRSSNDVYILI